LLGIFKVNLKKKKKKKVKRLFIPHRIADIKVFVKKKNLKISNSNYMKQLYKAYSNSNRRM